VFFTLYGGAGMAFCFFFFFSRFDGGDRDGGDRMAVTLFSFLCSSPGWRRQVRQFDDARFA